MVPITNNFKKTVAAVLPSSKGVLAIKECADGESLKNALKTLSENKPAICNVKNTINGEGIAFTSIYEQSTESLAACHLIGYTDDTGHGVSGLQLAYDDFLYSDNFASAMFTVDGKGNVLTGVEPLIQNDMSVTNSGVVTTVDVNIQRIVENAAVKMNSGCVIVAEALTGKIRAMASVPSFDINDLAKSLNGDNSPFLNRALLSYSVGSVFKPCVAAAAIENGKGSYMFNCNGSFEIADRQFRCHKLSGHGVVNLQGALAQSCNCYFYELALNLGGEPIYKLLSALNCGAKFKIANNFFAATGIKPSKKTLKNPGVLANLSIGQGNLLLSPVAMLNLYCAIAGDGCYFMPSVVEKTIKDGVTTQYDKGNKTKVMSANTASLLREQLKTVVTNGTGIEAATVNTTVAGKTATAQTGRYYDDGTEITNSWFCGFFPAEEPVYVAVVMSDSKLNVSTASIFAEIADKITLPYTKNVENNG